MFLGRLNAMVANNPVMSVGLGIGLASVGITTTTAGIRKARTGENFSNAYINQFLGIPSLAGSVLGLAAGIGLNRYSPKTFRVATPILGLLAGQAIGQFGSALTANRSVVKLH